MVMNVGNSATGITVACGARLLAVENTWVKVPTLVVIMALRVTAMVALLEMTSSSS